MVVTANLFLYRDRGYSGSIHYGNQRIKVQIVQGFFVLLLIIPCKYFGLPIPDPVLIVIASCVAIVIGFPMNNKYSYSPLECTLANATFIIAYILNESIDTYYENKRLLEIDLKYIKEDSEKGLKKYFYPKEEIHGYLRQKVGVS